MNLSILKWEDVVALGIDCSLISIKRQKMDVKIKSGGLYWTRTSDLSHVKGTRYQLRQETIQEEVEIAMNSLELKGFYEGLGKCLDF